MLSASHRLSTAAEFRQAVRRGRRAGGPLVVVHLASGNVDKSTSAPGGTSPARVGFVVSRAVGSAVIRNRVKRRLRHLVRERVGRLDDGALLVVRAQPAAAQASYRDLEAELDRCLDRVVGS
ncbi:MAG TPA: ribonuclease P protein component [Marmoricola sp.]|nr:ribonuclease P protein component [Marmoricola sp.]